MSNTKLYTFAANILIDLYYKALQWRVGIDAGRSAGCSYFGFASSDRSEGCDRNDKSLRSQRNHML
jgi:hypothetical protein